MSKKIKSLLIAGLLVLGMGGTAFANEVELPKVGTAVIKNPAFEDGVRVVSLQDGLITVKITENEDGTYDILTTWDSTKVNVTGLKTIYENGNLVSDDFFNPDYHCANIIKEGDIYKVSLEGLAEVSEGFDSMGKLVRIEVTYENLTKNDEPVVPPKDPEPPVDPEPTPEEEITDPETGDVSSTAFVATALLSAGVLVFTRKKDE